VVTKLIFRVGIEDPEAMNRDIVVACEAAVAAAARGEAIEATWTIRYESWRRFFGDLTPGRIAILEYLAKHETVPSTRVLARTLGRGYAGVQADVKALLGLRLLERQGTVLCHAIAPDCAEMTAA